MTSPSSAPKSQVRRGLPLFGFILLAAAALIPNLTSSLPDRDSGVFLYMGERILQGETPYLDVWDHKGPLIYFINALGVRLQPGGESGIWLLEAVALCATGVALFWGLKAAFGKKAAIVSTALFYGGLVLVLRPGNFTEEYALVFVACALLVLAKTTGAEGTSAAEPGGGNRGVGRWGAFVVGLTVGATLLLRPNLAGTPVVVAVLLTASSATQRGLRTGLVTAGWFALGSLVVIGPTLAFFYLRGGMAAAWDAYIVYNLLYFRSGGSSVSALLEGITALAPGGLPFLGSLGWFLALGGLARPNLRRPAIVVGILALPLEFVLVALAGRGLTHYYIAWLPILAWLCAVLLDRLGRWKLVGRSGTWAVAALAGLGILLPTWVVLRSARQVLVQGPRDATRLTVELSPYPEEILLMWGAEASYNYFSGRPSPSRFVYQYPLYACGYAMPEMVDRLAADIARAQPLIVDTSPTNRRVPPLDPTVRADVLELQEECSLSDEMLSLMDSIWNTYREAGRLPSTGWIVYERRSSDPG